MSRTSKRCGDCEQDLRAAEFHRSARSRDGLQSICKRCKQGRDKLIYERNKPRLIVLKLAGYRKRLAWHHDLKRDKPCHDCGGVFHPAAMQWDHREGTKKLGDVSNLIARASRARVEAEMRKCDLVCANCHALRTNANRLGR